MPVSEIFYNNEVTVHVISPSQSDSNKIAIYPNPVNYELRIVNYEGGEIQIINLTGQTLLSLPSFPFQERTIDVSALSSGVYFLKIGNSTVKFVKE